MDTLWVWAQFAILAAIIGFAGYHLSYHADRIAERTGLGRNWIGLILLSTITSLPELMTGISSVGIANKPDLAVGNILGACVFNLFQVVILDLLHREGSVYRKATQGHLLSAGFGIILLSYAGFGLTVGKLFPEFNVRHLSGFAATIPLFYILAMRTLYSFERSSRTQPVPQSRSEASSESTARIYTLFAISSVVVLAAGSALPFVGGRIMAVMGWNEAFVGTLFIAFATALPEIAVTVSALRIGAAELAFSNLLGSNLFNIVILSIDDLFYDQGPLFNAVTPTHAVTAFSAVMMTGLVLVALVETPRAKILNTISGMSGLILLVYLLNTYIVFKLGG